MQNKSILLAEDDPNDIELTLMALEEYNLGDQTIVVRDGAEVLDYLYCRAHYSDRAPGNPIVIFLDLKMPKVNGLEVLQQVKMDPNLQTIPIVALTSSRESKDIIESYNLGVNAYVVKPVNFTKFVEAVKQLCLFWIMTNEPIPEDIN